MPKMLLVVDRKDGCDCDFINDLDLGTFEFVRFGARNMIQCSHGSTVREATAADCAIHLPPGWTRQTVVELLTRMAYLAGDDPDGDGVSRLDNSRTEAERNVLTGCNQWLDTLADEESEEGESDAEDHPRSS